MSKEVERYGYGYVDDGNGNRYLGLIEKPDGNLVKHEDYKALLDERDAQWSLRRDAEADRDTARAALAEVRAERDRMTEALKYYADGEHFYLANEDAWDTVSGEPLNILHHDDGFGESEGYVEDGSIARAALQGEQQ